MQLERVFAAIPPLAFALLVVLVQASLHFVGYFDTASLAPLRLDFAYHFSPEPLTPAQAARTGFLPAELGDPRPAFADQHQWYRLRLANPGDAPQHPVLVVDNPIADVIRIYADSDGADAPRLLAELGDQVSVWDRELRSLPHHPLHVGAGEQASYLVEFVTEGTPFFPLTVMSAADFDDFRLTKFGINAGFVAVLLIITCYSYLVFVGIGDRAYLAYVYYALAVLLSFGISAGYIHYLLPGPLSAALSRHIITVNGLVLIAALNFGLYFLRFDIENRRLFRWGQRFSLTVGVLALLSTQVPERVSGPLFTLLHLLSYLWIIVLLSYRLRDRFQWTRFYWISWIPFFVGSALVSGMFQGLVPYSIPVRFGALGAVIFEIAFMGTALADRLSRLEKIRLFAATHDDKLGLPTSKLLESRLSSLLQEGPAGQICLLSIEVSNYHAVTPFLSNDEFRKVMLGLVEGFTRRIGACHELQSIDDESAPAPFASLPQSEIIAFVMQVNDRASLRALLEDLAAIENHNPCPDSVPYRVECLFGAAFNDRDYGTPSDFLNESRIALSRARVTGRSSWIFDDEDLEQGQRRIRLAQDLDTAIREGQLELFHQPQLRVGEAAYPCSEVLLRWTHPSLGPINPDEAVNIAEQAGLMRRLTDWVIEESARHVASVSSAAGTACSVAINVSAQDFAREDFAADISAILARHDVANEQFTIELTESSRMIASEKVNESVQALRRRGFRLSIDDFGTGYAAFSYALTHQVDEIKIDRSFLLRYPQDPRFRTVVDTILAMADELGIEVVAEGVENPEQAASLALGKCTFLQGYGYARPMPHETYVDWLSKDEALARRGLMGEHQPSA